MIVGHYGVVGHYGCRYWLTIVIIVSYNNGQPVARFQTLPLPRLVLRPRSPTLRLQQECTLTGRPMDVNKSEGITEAGIKGMRN